MRSKISHWFYVAVSSTVLIMSLSLRADVPAAVQAVFVNNGCLACHGNSGGLSLDDAATSETELIDVTATCDANKKRVVAGDPDNSVLYEKISNTNPTCGGIMPPGGPLISQADQDTIYNWILSIGPAGQFGLIQFESASVDVQEDSPSVTITVNRELGTEGVVMVDFTVSALAGDSATSPDDFIENSGTLTFAQGETSKTVTVDLVDDDIFEGTESFSVVLSNVSGGAVLGGRTLSKVNIIDNEFENKPGTFFFSATNYSVDESAGMAQLTVLRSFGAAGTVTIDYATSDGSALSGADYSSVMGTLTFAEGVKSQVFEVPIIEDADDEGDEQLTLTLSNPNGGADIGGATNVTLTIVDNDNSNGGGTGGGTGGGGTGGGSGGGTGGTGGTETPETEAAYSAAGSLDWLSLMLLLGSMLISVRKVGR